MDHKINIDKYIHSKATGLVGRPNGEQLLKDLKVDNIILRDLEIRFNMIEFIIPQRIRLLNKSFFLGWLETRVQELGKKMFEEKYTFTADNYIIKRIKNEYIDAALLTSKPDDIIKVDDN